jgi:Fe2+ or Zn2+ uptake regulation protein
VCDDKIVIIASNDPYHLGTLSCRFHVVWALGQRTRLGQGDDPVYVKSKCFDPFPFPETVEPLKSRIRETAEELDALRKQVQAEHPHLTLTQLYNVLDKLRAGQNLTDEDEAIKTDGLVLILRELHDRLDSLVAEAYGWPVDLSDEDILARLVALNAERAAEEKRGLVRWLRPDYQRPRAGLVDAQAMAEAEAQTVAPLIVEAGQIQKPAFPTSDLERAAAVFAALIDARKPLDARSLAATFKQGAKVAPAILRVLASLARLGHVHTSDGTTFALRRSA